MTDIYACGVTLYRMINGDSILPPLSPHQARDMARLGKFPNRALYRDFIPRPLKLIVNKAINVDPSSRFQSAADMRHAIEQVTVEKNWSEKTVLDGVEWTCGWDRKCYEVVRRGKPDRSWEVVVRKGRTKKKSLRRMSELCMDEATKRKAEQHSRRVLQGFVLGRLR